MPEEQEQQRRQRPREEQAPWNRQENNSGGPRAPETAKPDTNSILKKLKTVNPNQAKRYKQRTGE
jgi:hypothetical protein